MVLDQPNPDPITYDTMVSEVSAIVKSSDSSLMTDFFLVHPTDPEMERWQTSCEGKECTVYINGVPSRLSFFSSLELLDPADDYRFFTGSGGVKMVDIREISENESGEGADFKSLGGWLDHSSFVAATYRITKGVSDDGVDLIEIFHAYSFGQATGTTPAFGNATWTGTMVGGDTSLTANRGNRIQGDATLSFDLSQLDIDVAFRNIRDIDIAFSSDIDDTARRSHEDIVWQNIPVTSGSFATGSDENSIEGQFYGPNHEEVGGIFERNEIVGAFGAKR